MNLTQTQNYFEDIARLHTQLLHNPPARQAFARFQTDAHITAIRKNATPNVVVVSGINGQRIGQQDDGELRLGYQLLFASRAATSGSAALTIDAALNTAMEIMFDFIARIEHDQAESCEVNFDLETLTFDDFPGPWLDNYYGFLLFLPVRSHVAQLNPNKFTDLMPPPDDDDG